MGSTSLLLLALVILFYRGGRKMRRLVPVVALLVVGNAQAESWYLGGSFGVVDSDESISHLNGQLSAAGLDASASSVDDKRTGWKLYTGRDLTDYIGVELGYANLGDSNVEIKGNVTDIDTALNSVTDIHPSTAQGIFAHVKVHIPLATKTRLNLSAGPFLWRAKYTISTTGASKNVDESGNSISLGVGLSQQLTKSIQLRLEGDNFMIDGENILMWTLGAAYQFGQ